MSFSSDIDQKIKTFKDNIENLHVSITEYNNYFESVKNDYVDSELLKERMIDNIHKGVFISDFEKKEDSDE